MCLSFKVATYYLTPDSFDCESMLISSPISTLEINVFMVEMPRIALGSSPTIIYPSTSNSL
ncbi:uncharacterized protein METZ01_LOCUS245066 [marine metagenome]|uniref:Uncharacterized protein n=1 Tax=marine metagenome TaxID=408172 RepID=A0A382HYQ0_9ZZZZ